MEVDPGPALRFLIGQIRASPPSKLPSPYLYFRSTSQRRDSPPTIIHLSELLYNNNLIMATHILLSPVALSPRKPLQNLSTNLPNTPKLTSTKLVQHASPFNPNVSLTPATLLSLKQQYQTDSGALNASRKRPFDEIVTVEERDSSQARASFSSLINYDPPTTSPKQSEQSEVSTPPPLTAESNTIKIVR
jgi:hypothetical protein